MNLRTDLALERHEAALQGNPNGICFEKYSDGDIEVTKIKVYNEHGEKELGKPVGTYLNFDVTSFLSGSELFSSPELKTLSKHIKSFLPQNDGTVLVVGLGNDEITADSLGPQTASLVFSTRHIENSCYDKAHFGDLRSVCAVSTGVLGRTGIEAAEMTQAIVKRIKPCAVITVDALAARNIDRIGKTVQISTSGIVPGSGVGNSRKEISEKTVGVPVLSIGVPTVVDALTFAYDIIGERAADIKIGEGEITVTPKDIDIMTERAARLIAMSINCALQDNLSPEEIFAVVSQ